MTTRESGVLVPISTVGEICKGFVPNPLPPKPPIQFGDGFQALYGRANRALGRLDGLAAILPDRSLFLYMYIRKEAVLSSQIEGTQSSLSDLLLFEDADLPGVPLDDVREVSNYVAAMELGIQRITEGLPLSLRLIKEVHARLLADGRGADKQPGEFRRSQNWIGGSRPGNARYVPPPVDRLMECMGALERFLNDEPAATPTLIKAALAHVQFESIHPFLDGNGRVGRLLITLILFAEKAIHEPLLYLSLYFKTHRDEYYDRLQRVRANGDWEGWLDFFLQGVETTSDQACATARRLLDLFEQDRQQISGLGRPAGSALRVHEALRRHPVLSVSKMAKRLKLTEPTARAAARHLVKLGIVREITGRHRNQLFAYDAYLKILSEGTEPFRARAPAASQS